MVSRTDLDTVPGWFDPLDEALFRAILQDGPTGDLAELGVYLGKSAVLMGEYLRPGETFTVIDLFEQEATDAANEAENRSTYPDLSRAAFERNYLRFHPQLPTVITGFSQTITDHASEGTHRFVHIDASHLYEHVVADIVAARRLLAPNGVVVFDDIRTAHTPGVAAAAWTAVADGLRPFAISTYKLYATWGDVSLPPLDDWPWEVQEIAGCEVRRYYERPDVEPSTAQRWLQAALPPAVMFRLDKLRR